MPQTAECDTLWAESPTVHTWFRWQMNLSDPQWRTGIVWNWIHRYFVCLNMIIYIYKYTNSQAAQLFFHCIFEILKWGGRGNGSINDEYFSLYRNYDSIFGFSINFLHSIQFSFWIKYSFFYLNFLFGMLKRRSRNPFLYFVRYDIFLLISHK